MSLEDALSGVRRLFLDTAPIIYHVEGHPRYQPLTDRIFDRISDGTIAATTSSITLAECLVHPYRRNDLFLATRFRDVITAGTNTRCVGVDAVAEEPAQYRARYNLSLTDAFQVAASLASGCDAFLSNDAALHRVTELSILILDELEV